MITDDQLQKAISTTIAEKIINGLDEPYRQQLLVKSITKALDDYSVRYKIEETVAAKATEVAREMMSDPIWVEKVQEQVRKGFQQYLELLPAATFQMLLQAMHGKEDGSYGTRPGDILKHLKPLSRQG